MKMPFEVARGSLVENLPVIENPSLAENLSGVVARTTNDDGENALLSKCSLFQISFRNGNSSA